MIFSQIKIPSYITRDFFSNKNPELYNSGFFISNKNSELYNSGFFPK